MSFASIGPTDVSACRCLPAPGKRQRGLERHQSKPEELETQIASWFSFSYGTFCFVSIRVDENCLARILLNEVSRCQDFPCKIAILALDSKIGTMKLRRSKMAGAVPTKPMER